MKLADAQMLLKLEKEKGPLTERWWCETDEGILLEAWPLGFARGSFKFSDAFTVIPHHQYSALFQGIGTPHHIKVPKMSPHHLWEQEAYVYYLEMRAAMRKATEDLEHAPILPRAGEYDEEKHRQISHISTDPTPQPEDFALFPERPLWIYEGKSNQSHISIAALKNGFIRLLERFVNQGGPHGQRETV